MKKLKRVIAFFILILTTGIFITVISVKKTLNRETTYETVKVTKDSLNKLDTKSKTV